MLEAVPLVLDLTPEQQTAVDNGLKLVQHMQDAKPAFPAGTVLGQPLVWRVLDRVTPDQNPLATITRFFVGNFDADADQELLYRHDQVWLLNSDGTREELTFPDYAARDEFSNSPIPATTWDYDGDGIDDIISDEFDRLHAGISERRLTSPSDQQTNLSDHMAVFSLSGKRLGELAGVPMGPFIGKHDLDGDGRIDLFMYQAGTYMPDPHKGVRGFATGGRFIFSAGPEWGMATTAGDLDGDGRDELLSGLQRANLEAIGLGKSASPVTGAASPADLAAFKNPRACLDLDGDHRGELLSWEGDVLNLATGQRSQLQPVPGYAEFNASEAGPNSFLLADVLGQRCIVALVGHEVVLPETLVIWSTSGKLLYAENLGEFAKQADIVHAGGMDHIVVRTSDRLLIWP